MMSNTRVLGAAALLAMASLLAGCAVYPVGPPMGYPAPYSGYQQPYQQPQGVVQGPAYYGGYPGGYYGGAYSYYAPQVYFSFPFFLGGHRGDGGFRGRGRF